MMTSCATTLRKFPLKQNDSFFTLQRHAVRDFVVCETNNALSLRILTFDVEVLRFQ